MTKFAGIISQGNIQQEVELTRMLTSMSRPLDLEPKPFIRHENVILGATDSSFYSNATQSIYISVNGLILNLPDLKKRLENAGQTVHSDSQQDLLILAFLTWGHNMFKYLSGPFIIVFFDAKRKKITIARDRLGAKSLYWGKVGKNFLFSTELKGILSSNLISQTPDLNDIASYFFLGYFPQDKTPIRGINRLLPGYYLQINEDQEIILNKYWSLRGLHSKDLQTSQQEVNEKTEHLLHQAIQRRIDLDPQVSCYLSPDVGSTALGHLLKHNTDKEIHSYSFDFEGTKLTSSEYAKRDAGQYGFQHQNFLLQPTSIFDRLQHLVWQLDEPVADPYTPGFWQIAQNLNQRGCKNFFCSLGSFELFGSQIGYGEIPYEPFYLWMLYLTKPFFLKALVPLFSKFNKKISFDTLRFFQRDFWALEYTQQHALFSRKNFRQIAPSLHGLFDLHLFTQQSYQYLKFLLSSEAQLEDYLFFDAETSLSNRLVAQYEKIFSAQGIQFLSPYFDLDVIEYVFSLPEKYKIHGKKIGAPLHHLVEKEFSNQHVTNFPQRSPWFLNQWTKHPRVKAIFSLLPKGVLAESNIIDGPSLKKVLEKQKWTTYEFDRLWAILILEIWFNLFVNNPIYTYPQEQPLEDFLKAQQQAFIL